MCIPVTARQIGALLGNGFTRTTVSRILAGAISAAEGSPATGGHWPATGGPGTADLGGVSFDGTNPLSYARIHTYVHAYILG